MVLDSQSHATGTPPVSVSLFGAGAWARTAHLASLAERDDVIFDAIYDPDRKRAVETAAEFAFMRIADSAEDLFAGPGEACIVASPAALHESQALAALSADRHVLLEKPMTNSAKSAWSIAALAAARQRHVMLALGWNYSPVFAEASRVLATAPLGTLEHVVMHLASGTHDLLSGQSSNSSGRDHRPALSATWTDSRLSGGGYGNAQLSHALGLLFGLVNEDSYDVAAAVRRGPIPGIELSLAVSGMLESGATLAISGTSLRPSSVPVRQQLDLRMFGSEGQLHVDFARDRVARVDPNGIETVVALPVGAGVYPGTAPANAFIDLITGKTMLNLSDAVVGARSTEILDVVRSRMEQ